MKSGGRACFEMPEWSFKVTFAPSTFSKYLATAFVSRKLGAWRFHRTISSPMAAPRWLSDSQQASPGRHSVQRLVGSSEFPRVLAAVLPGASNHSLGFAFRHSSDASPVLLAHVVIDLDSAWIQPIPSVPFAAGDPISDVSLRIKVIAFESSPLTRPESLSAVMQRPA